ncbi:ribonuclease domain-containing protein [Kaistella pullorum]|uniref:Ribonuclease n=1 Tax=Kaistella pullorum TaxID=2763074 RepID=A0ABR8WNU5_9FLAO|nr:ribonuclease domain-containing protein [Kaistella pullorum]MBD8018618.1 ribonuclease N [Kaistella pullorum]
MKHSIKLVLFFIIGMLSAFLVMYLIDNYLIEKKGNTEKVYTNGNSTGNNNEKFSETFSPEKNNSENSASKSSGNNSEIDELTAEKLVVDFVQTHKKLPEYYLTKGEARNKGWVASKGNLCDVLPGRAIGGDKFSNREKTLPTGAQYFEADVNYTCGRRNADRIVFTENGDVWLTHDHYKTFQKQ